MSPLRRQTTARASPLSCRSVPPTTPAINGREATRGGAAVRIDNLTYSNIQTQGARRREWLRQYSPQHLEQSAALMLSALQDRAPAASRSTLVLGAGACTEIPLTDLARAPTRSCWPTSILPLCSKGAMNFPRLLSAAGCALCS